MPQYLALTYTADVDWWAPEQADELAEYRAFAQQHADRIRASAVLHPTSTATVVRVEGARGGHVVTTDGPYAETKEQLGGFYLVDLPDLGTAVQIAALLPREFTIEVRPTLGIEV